MLKTIGEPLSEDLVKAFHYELKAGVFEDRANGYAIGDYKKRPKFVGNIKTAIPEDVEYRMSALTEWYHSVKDKNLETIATLHARYESIHPFQDGKHSMGQMIIKSKYQAKLKIKELDIFLFQILLIILNKMI